MPPLDTPHWFNEIDHTGDIGIQVRADSLPQLFERAAEGTFRILTDPSSILPDAETTVSVQGRDLDALMVRWLSELNYRHTVHHHLFCDFQVEDIERSGGELELTATIRGESIDPDRHIVYTEIKAVTFHGLHVRQTDGGWTTQVIFDM